MKKSNTITQRFFISVILPTVLTSVLLIVISTYLTQKIHTNSYMKRFDRSLYSMSYALGSSVWTYDLKAIESMIEAFSRVWDVAGMQVFDQYDGVLASTGKIDTQRNASRVLPMYSANMNKIGEIRLWMPIIGSREQEFFLMLFRITLFVSLFLLLSYYLFYRLIKKSIISSLLDVQKIVSSGNMESANSSINLKSMPDEIRTLAHNIIINNTQVKATTDNFKSDLKEEVTLVNSLQSLLSESNQTCVVLSDTGEVLTQNISEPFLHRHLPTLIDIVSNTIDPVTGLTNAGFDVHRIFTEQEGSVAASYEIVAENGETLIVKLLRLNLSSIALVAYNVSHAKWSDLLIDELLGLNKSGLAIFDRAGRLQMEKGESLKRLLNDDSDHDEINLARVLLEFPKIGKSSENSSVSFEHKLSEDKIYRVNFSQHEHSGIGITHHDITEERKVEKTLVESQRLNDLGRITSGVAHDFNNSLGIVIGQLELALASEGVIDNEGHIETALAAANQSTNVVKQLMTYSRNQPQELVVVAIDEVIDTQKNMFQSAVGGGVCIYYELGFNGIVCLDVELFVSVLLNLLINAGDAMDGKGSIYVKTRRDRGLDGKTNMIVLSIQDTGKGISKEIINEVFLPFFTTKKNNIGNGLGLSMVQGFVDQLSGYIRVENNDTGACFHLFLPEYQETLSTPVHQQPAPVQIWEQPEEVSEQLLVMVDDNELLLETNVQLLHIHGLIVKGFSDCFDAIDFIKSSDNVGCLVVDMKMPQMSGLEFIDHVNPYINMEKIILYSGNFEDSDIVQAGKRGIHKILRKPLNSAKTLESVHKCMSIE